MNSELMLPPWLPEPESIPLCDVPWRGTTSVLSDGELRFCCHSPVSVGNVVTKTFDEVWNGLDMQRIRNALARHEFPPECAQSSCPIYRKDHSSHIVERAIGRHHSHWQTKTDPHADMRANLHSSHLLMDGDRAREGHADGLVLHLQSNYGIKEMSLFVSLRPKTMGTDAPPTVFLPELVEYPLPGCFIAEQGHPLDRKIELGGEWFRSDTPQTWELSVSLFEGQSNPSVWTNCVWCLNQDLKI